MRELISVVVPIYNVEAYIKRCLESLREQTYKNLEIILVDDGSTDASGKLCEEYAQADSRFHVIHQENKGVLRARNTGIEKAKGAYIGFVDGDDWIEKEMYHELYQRICEAQAEIAMCRKCIFDERSNSSFAENSVLEEGVYKGYRLKKVWDNLFFRQDYSGIGISLNLYDKLFKKELILENYKQVDMRLHYFEDMALSFFCMLQASGIVICDEPFYYYRQRSNSLCHSRDSGYLEQVSIFYQLLNAAASNCSEELLSRFHVFVAERAVYGVNHMMGLKLKQGIPFYFPPFEKISFTDRVVLYGAGEIGRLYYQMFQMARAGQIILWIDRQYERLQSQGIPVEGVHALQKKRFDKILIGVKSKSSASVIRNDLIQMGVAEEKIIWESPQMLTEA